MDFATVIRSPEAVRCAFDGVRGWAWWWRVILALHGKPGPGRGTPEERRSILVKGFRFYGHLSRLLATMLLGLGVLLAFELRPQAYWVALPMLAGAYLVAASSLAYQGARRFGLGEARGSVLLAVFFVALMLFLGAFAAVASVVANEQGVLQGLPNAALFGVFWLVGIGSYGLELVYLLCGTDGVTSAAP